MLLLSTDWLPQHATLRLEHPPSTPGNSVEIIGNSNDIKVKIVNGHFDHSTQKFKAQTSVSTL